MKTAIFLFIPVILFSCVKRMENTTIPFSEASYKVIITMNWATPKFGVPPGAHFTTITGMIHPNDTFLWKPGSLASTGLEDIAEVGNNAKMNAQIDAILSKNKALSKFVFAAPPISGTFETNITVNTNYSYISFATMIAPSPDWFTGIHDFSLFSEKMWISDITLNLLAYDAGTEDGDRFAYDNPETVPQQNITLLTPANATVLANGNPSIAPIGTIRFIRN